MNFLGGDKLNNKTFLIFISFEFFHLNFARVRKGVCFVFGYDKLWKTFPWTENFYYSRASFLSSFLYLIFLFIHTLCLGLKGRRWMEDAKMLRENGGQRWKMLRVLIASLEGNGREKLATETGDSLEKFYSFIVAFSRSSKNNFNNRSWSDKIIKICRIFSQSKLFSYFQFQFNNKTNWKTFLLSLQVKIWVRIRTTHTPKASSLNIFLSKTNFFLIQFQNRRMKWRNSKERELLASGGSRDQTLPNKNNPNPDLSDAKTDRQASMSPPSSITPPNEAQQQQMCIMRSPSDQQSSNKSSPVDQKFMVKKPGDMKYEIDEMNSRSTTAGAHPPIGQLFNNFYDNQSSDGSVKAFSNQSNSMYYDEYDSNDSDDSEEINVTWLSGKDDD